MKNNLQQVYEKSRVAFMQKGCHVCRIWKRFIERENLKLKPNKRIIIIDATLMNEWGILNNPLLKVFEKYIKEFPSIFIDGKLITLGNTPEEAVNYLRGLLHDDYIEPNEKYEFRLECEYRNTKLGRSLVCSGEIDDN